MNTMQCAKPKVSVCVVTYNHENYIRDCLQSLVAQQTNFQFEVVVADDCSSDTTREVVREYAENYPHIVRYIFHPKNIGPAPNYTFVHEQALGEYIAHMDGDDYALPGKLQAQADYLDEHPNCSMVWHRMKLHNVGKNVLVDDLINPLLLPPGGFTRSDVIRYITIGMNSSKMYRAALRDIELPEFPVVDYFINVEQIMNGVAAFVGDKPLGVYRVGIGVASAGNATKRILRDSFMHILRKYPDHRHDVAFAALVLFLAALKNKQWQNVRLFLEVIGKSLSVRTAFDIYSERKMVAMFKFPAEARKAN